MTKKGFASSAAAIISVIVLCALVTFFFFTVTDPIAQEKAAAAAEAERNAYFPDEQLEEFDPAILLDGVDAAYRSVESMGYLIYARADGSGGLVRVAVCLDRSGKINRVDVLEAAEQPTTMAFKLKWADYAAQYAGAAKITSSDSVKGARYIEPVEGADYASRAVFSAVTLALQEYSVLSRLEIVSGGESDAGK